MEQICLSVSLEAVAAVEGEEEDSQVSQKRRQRLTQRCIGLERKTAPAAELFVRRNGRNVRQ